jgi:ribosomal protein S27E
VKLKEKVAYLQGLTNGMDINSDTREGRLLINVVDVLEDIAEAVEGVRLQQNDLEQFVETIDEDLTVLEDDYYDIDIETVDANEADYGDEDGIDFVEVECPSCHEKVHFEEELLLDDEGIEISCPNCGGIVYDTDFDIVDIMEDDRMEARSPGL